MKKIPAALLAASLSVALTSCVNVFASKPPATASTDPIDYCITYIEALETGLINLKVVPYALTVDQDGYRQVARHYCTKNRDADSEINAGLQTVCRLKGGSVEEGGGLQWCTASDGETPLYGWLTPTGGEDVCSNAYTGRLFINAAPAGGEKDPRWLKHASDKGYRSGKDAGVVAASYESIGSILSGGTMGSSSRPASGMQYRTDVRQTSLLDAEAGIGSEDTLKNGNVTARDAARVHAGERKPGEMEPDELKALCDSGSGIHCMGLGINYVLGRKLPQDPQKGRAYVIMGCEKGSAEACSLLGVSVEARASETPDPGAALKEAFMWYQKACALGDLNSCESEARMQGR